MSMHGSNIAMLRALGDRLQRESDAAMATEPLAGVLFGLDDRFRLVGLLRHQARACLGAATDLEAEAKRLVERVTGPPVAEW